MNAPARRSQSFGEKVSRLLTLTSGAMVFVVAAVLATLDWLDSARELRERIDSHTRIVAMNSSAPLAFADRTNATEALEALAVVDDIGSATLYDLDQEVFARYRHPQTPGPDLSDPLPRGDGGARWRVLNMPVADQAGRQGSLQVVYDLRPLWQRGLLDIGLALAVTIIAMALVHLLSLRLRRVLVKPVDELALAARTISRSGDYSHRARKFSDDELGQFTDSFNEMLAQIERQNAELTRARQQAEHASQMKDEFLATVSHELRTPMTPILGWAQLLRFAARDNEQVQQAATVIERNARIQTQIVDDLLDMSRIVSGKVRLEFQVVALADILDAAIATIEGTAATRGVRLEVRRGGPALHVRADAGRLQQVFWNLLSNAVKFTEAGGLVTLHCSTVATCGGGQQVRVQVIDTGQGIAADFLPQVFERFRQADSSITRRHGGLGVGLAIARQLVELHGGSIGAASAGAGQGATFEVLLPLVAAAPADLEPAALAAAELRQLEGRRVLVVDDQPDSLALLVHLLQRSGAMVDQALSADAALDLLGQARYDVLVSDIAMPGRDGFELLAALRRQPEGGNRRIRALAITAFAREEDRAHALAAGFDEHLSKPVDNTGFVAAVARLASCTQP